jgi:hypothetical protein
VFGGLAIVGTLMDRRSKKKQAADQPTPESEPTES